MNDQHEEMSEAGRAAAKANTVAGELRETIANTNRLLGNLRGTLEGKRRVRSEAGEEADASPPSGDRGDDEGG
jgi:hypothetical protein